jgi:hypothetical protein
VVVEADEVPEAALSLLQWSRSYAVPELLLDSTLYPLHLAVEVGGARPDSGMTDASGVARRRSRPDYSILQPTE